MSIYTIHSDLQYSCCAVMALNYIMIIVLIIDLTFEPKQLGFEPKPVSSKHWMFYSGATSTEFKIFFQNLQLKVQ